MPPQSLMFRIRAALKTISLPEGGDLVGTGRVRDISVSPAGVAKADLKLDDLPPQRANDLAARAKTSIEAVDGVARAVIIGGPPPPQMSGGHANALGLTNKKQAAIAADAETLRDVTRIIAVASGKGGVGKSTITLNLALAAAARGLKVGLIDADIYGPSLPTLLGLNGVKPDFREGRLQPLMAHGLATMSIGYLVEEQKADAWRGPMVMGASRQLFNDVDWGTLDLMLIDTPPGTGDVHLTLGQMTRNGRPLLDGAVIVSTPQELALADVRRGAAFFRKVDVPILGVIENMAYLAQADGSKLHLFGDGGARRAAQDLEAPFLGEIPILPDLRARCDAGTPVDYSLEDDEIADSFRKVFDILLTD